MKRFVITACILALTLSMSTTAFAAEDISSGTAAAFQETTDTKITDVQKNFSDKKAVMAQQRADNSAFREAVKAERDIVKANRDLNKALLQENSDLRQVMKEKLKSLKDSGTDLDADTAAKLEALNAELKSAIDELKASKGAIKEVAVEKKSSLESRDFEAMKTAFEKIGDIQKARNEKLSQINDILKDITALLP